MQQQTGDTTVVCTQYIETLMLAILGNILGALVAWSPCWGDLVQIVTQRVHGGHIHLHAEKKPIRLGCKSIEMNAMRGVLN